MTGLGRASRGGAARDAVVHLPYGMAEVSVVPLKVARLALPCVHLLDNAAVAAAMSLEIAPRVVPNVHLQDGVVPAAEAEASDVPHAVRCAAAPSTS
jgi:hypothetical protein